MDKDRTHFGFKSIGIDDKTHLVRDVFDSVADKYDLMNDLMSFGLHRMWKRHAVDLALLRPGQRVLDLAAGSGDMAQLIARRVGRDGQVILSDINNRMLQRGRNRMLDQGLVGNTSFAQADAEMLPFVKDSFDCITIAFGLRNVTRKERALESMFHVLRPGGRVLVLEFSTPNRWLKAMYEQYTFNTLPLIGKIVANDADSYRYLAESISVHPDQKALRDMLSDAGFNDCEYFNMCAGIVAIHRAYKY